MNKKLAKIAEAAIDDPAFEKGSGFCQRFARQCIAKMYGSKYEKFRALSAKQTGLNFLQAGIGVRNTGQALEIGDVLYVTTGSGGFGHVGILVGPNLVAENSTAHHSAKNGAKGHRTLDKFPHYQIIVRLPSTDVEPAVVEQPKKKKARLIIGFTEPLPSDEINYEEVEDARLVKGQFLVNSVRLANLLGASAVHLKGGTAPIRDVLDKLDLPIYETKDFLKDKDDPRMLVFVRLNQ